MANSTRPVITALVYGLYEGGYRVSVSINGAVRAVGNAADRLSGERMARSIKRKLKRQMRRSGDVLPSSVIPLSA